MTRQPTLPFLDPPMEREARSADGNPPSQDSGAGSDRRLPSWLGLVTNNRRLFEASQDGWLRPLAGSGFLLGHESFVSEEFSTGGNVIPVRLAFDVDKLPFPDARKDLEPGAMENGDRDEPRVVPWRAPIPLYAVKTVEVPSIEQKTRLVAIADQTSNVCLPDREVTVRDFALHSPSASGPDIPESPSLELPGTLNAVQGAMAMAVWAVPHIEPWIEVLRQALDRDAAGVAEGTGRLDAQWLHIPWLVRDLSGPARDDADDQERLWRAALSCMQWSTAGDESPAALAERIAQAACLDGTNPWLDRTRRIVAADETFACDGWRENAAGLAIWLALLRPDPTRFRSWNKDLPGVPPGVWWAAAALCGWRHGYRALDKKFRGDAALREYLATRALAASWPGGEEATLPPSQRSPLERSQEDGCFTLTWRGQAVLRKEWKSRAKWYAADLTDIAVGRAARDLAGRSGWACTERCLPLPEGRLLVVGSGRLSVDGDALVVEGEKSLRLPKNVDVEERIDPDEFRRLLATEAGDLPDPPETSPRQPSSQAGILAEPQEALIGQPATAPPGLIYRPDFIAEEQETELLECIDGAEWITELPRRVQHYGWRYDYKAGRIDESMRLGELPEWAGKLARRLVDEGLMEDLPDQVIVNEYVGDQGIGPHSDSRSFTGEIATISLLETWDMWFSHRGEKKIVTPLDRRSVAVMTDEARYQWKHEIPKRMNEVREDGQGKKTRVKRTRRVSLTFRKTRKGGDA